MKFADVKVGQRVRVTERSGAFLAYYFQKTGVVECIGTAAIYVKFDQDGRTDYGNASELELVQDVKASPANVKEAIANVEAALAALKALVG